MEIITVECMNPRPHKAHSWREGFLWLSKKTCGGAPERHKHRLILQKFSFTDRRKLVWHCKCGKFFSCYRQDFHLALRNPLWYPVKNEI